MRINAGRIPFWKYKSTRPEISPQTLMQPSYAIDDQKQSNISYREAESLLIAELGLPQRPQEFKYGDAIVLMDYLMQKSRVMLDERAIFAVRARGYDWRRDVHDVNPETALYLDAYARLNEIHDKLYSEEDERARAFQLLREGGHT